MNDETGSIERGTVGWSTGEHADLGTDDNDGHTLVHVTLFTGHDPTRPRVEGRAQGKRILCQLGGGVFDVPPEGTPVVVAVPAGMAAIPGGPVIIATVRKNPTAQYAEDRSVIDYGPNKHLVLKAKSVTICDYSSPARFITVGESVNGGPPGITAMSETGSGWTIQESAVGMFSASGGEATSMLQLGPDEASLIQKSSGFCRLTGGNCDILASSAASIVAGNVAIGAAATLATPACVGAVGVSAVGSTTVFISP